MKGIERILLSNDLVTYCVLIGLVLLFLMKVFNPVFLKNYALAFFTQGFIEEVAEQRPKFFSAFPILIQLFSLLVVSLITYLLLTSNYFYPSIPLFLKVLSVVVVYFVFKNVFIAFIVNLLHLKSRLNYLLFSKNGYLYTCCLLLFPIIILYQYGFKNDTFLCSFVCFLLIFRLFLILKNNKTLVFRHLFYFILYFCTLELAPLMLIFKTIELN